MELTPRVSTFFFLIGSGALVLFILSALGSRIDPLFLLVALIGLSLGFAFRKKKETPPPSKRFESLRRMNEQSRKRREEKEKKKKK